MLSTVEQPDSNTIDARNVLAANMRLGGSRTGACENSVIVPRRIRFILSVSSVLGFANLRVCNPVDRVSALRYGAIDGFVISGNLLV
jgi:hypothetical protein